MILHYKVHVGAMGCLLLACAGCTHALPRYSWHGPEAALDTMRHRDRGVQTFSATCRLLLRAESGDVELSGVLIARPPSHLRLRASKLSHTVFDITLTPEGLFVLTKRRENHGSKAASLLTRDGLVEAASLLPGFAPQATWQIHDDAHERYFSRKRTLDHGESVITCSVEKNTLTTTRCDYRDRAGSVRQSITFDDYRAFGEVVWPMHLIGVGTGGSFEILFHTVEINPDLPPRAFVPPHRAVKQP